MTKKDGAYEHQGEVAGFGSGSGSTPSTEHQDTAAPSAEERNELDSERRKHLDEYGPRTHSDTRTVHKGEE